MEQLLSSMVGTMAKNIANKYDLDENEVKEVLMQSPVTDDGDAEESKPTAKAVKPKPTKAPVEKAKTPAKITTKTSPTPTKKALAPSSAKTTSKCSGIVKKKEGGDTPCPAKGKEEYNGKWYCGRHIAGAKKVSFPATSVKGKTKTEKPPPAPVLKKVEKIKKLNVTQILDAKGKGTGKYWHVDTRILIHPVTRKAYAVHDEDGSEKQLGKDEIKFLETNNIPYITEADEDETADVDDGEEEADEDGETAVDEDEDAEDEDEDGEGDDSGEDSGF